MKTLITLWLAFKSSSFLLTLKELVLFPLSLLDSGSFTVKMTTSVMLAFSLSPVWVFMQETLDIAFGNEVFLRIIVIALTADLISGIIKHLMLHSFNFEKLFIGFIKKVAVSFIGMSLFNTFAAIDAGDLFTLWVLVVGMIANFIYVGGSAFANLYVISGKKFPPVGFMERLEGFNKDLSVKKLINGEEEK